MKERSKKKNLFFWNEGILKGFLFCFMSMNTSQKKISLGWYSSWNERGFCTFISRPCIRALNPYAFRWMMHQATKHRLDWQIPSKGPSTAGAVFGAMALAFSLKLLETAHHTDCSVVAGSTCNALKTLSFCPLKHKQWHHWSTSVVAIPCLWDTSLLDLGQNISFAVCRWRCKTSLFGLALSGLPLAKSSAAGFDGSSEAVLYWASQCGILKAECREEGRGHAEKRGCNQLGTLHVPASRAAVSDVALGIWVLDFRVRSWKLFFLSVCCRFRCCAMPNNPLLFPPKLLMQSPLH